MLTKQQIETNELIRAYIVRIHRIVDDIEKDFSYFNPLRDLKISNDECHKYKNIKNDLYNIMKQLDNIYNKYNDCED